MVTAADSSVLLDVIVAGSPHAEISFQALDRARMAGRIVACPVVWAEVSAVFEDHSEMALLIDAGIDLDPFDRDASEAAGQIWSE